MERKVQTHCIEEVLGSLCRGWSRFIVQRRFQVHCIEEVLGSLCTAGSGFIVWRRFQVHCLVLGTFTLNIHININILTTNNLIAPCIHISLWTHFSRPRNTTGQ